MLKLELTLYKEETVLSIVLDKLPLTKEMLDEPLKLDRTEPDNQKIESDNQRKAIWHYP